MLQDDWGEFINCVNTNGILSMAKRLGVPGKQEERDMVARAQAGSIHDREQLIIRHSPFVVTLVKKMRFRGGECADLFNCGLVGMDKAITKFDLNEYKYRLISYGVWWSRQEMLIEIMRHSSTVRIPINKHIQMQKLRRLVKECKERGTPIDVNVLAKKCKLSVASCKDMIVWVDDPKSMNGELHWNRDSDGFDHDEIGDFVGYMPNDDVADESEFLHFFDIVKGTKKLTEKEKHIIIQRQLHGRTLDDIATDYGVSRERIRQVELYAMQKMAAVVAHHDRVHKISRSDRSSMLEMGVPQC